MSQILKSLQLPTSSITPGTPPSGFGTVYASGSNKLFYKNPSGTQFDLLTPNGFINIRYYTGSGTGSGVTQTYTWSKPPAGLKYLEVCCVGAGGGGGSGRKSAPAVQGGTGGGGGAIVWATFDASILSSNYTITVGAGGAGAPGQTTANTSGISGVGGGTSSFGTLVVARGGQGGGGGAASGVRRTEGGLATSCTPSGYPHSYTGCNSATSANVPANPVFNAPNIFDILISSADTLLAPGFNVSLGFGGGGGGNGGSASATVITSGSRGSSGYQFTTLITNGGNPGSGSIGQNATPPTNNMITTLLQFTGSTTTYGLGGGGHGGSYSGGTFNGGAGSNGGLYGAGGGGGGAFGATTALSSSGAGGSGSSGLCIVVEFY